MKTLTEREGLRTYLQSHFLTPALGRAERVAAHQATFYPDRDQAQGEIRQVVRRRLQHGYTVVAWQ